MMKKTAYKLFRLTVGVTGLGLAAYSLTQLANISPMAWGYGMITVAGTLLYTISFCLKRKKKRRE